MAKLKLENVRLSFPALFDAEDYNGDGKFKYKATFLVPADGELKKKVDAEIMRVATEKWAGKARAVLEEVMPDKKACCWIKGERKDYDGYAGNWALSAGRAQKDGRPLIFDQAKRPLTAADGKPYAGCYVDALVEIYVQDNKNGKGIRCSLLGVQFRADGDAFAAGSVAAADDFDDLGDGAGADSNLFD